MWAKFSKWFKSLSWVVKTLKFFKAPIPYLSQLSVILTGIQYVLNSIKKWILAENVKEAEAKIKEAEEQAKRIEAERQKPLPQQNNDVLREEARKRHRNGG